MAALRPNHLLTIYSSAPFVTSGNKQIRKRASCPTARAWMAHLPSSHQNVASIAATGFGLTSLCIAADRRWITKPKLLNAHAIRYASSTRKLFISAAGSITGWTRKPASDVGTVKSLRSTRHFCSAACSRCASVFAKIAKSCNAPTRIYNRVDFRWMLNGHPLLLSHGWKPESGFLRALGHIQRRHDLYLLAIGSPTYPISPASWYALVARSLSLRGSQLLHDHRRAFIHAPVLTRVDRLSKPPRDKRRPHRLF